MSTLAVVPLFIGTSELVLLGGLALLLFGGKKLPEMMKGLGQGVQSFKKGMNEPIPEDEEVKPTKYNADHDGEPEPKQEEPKTVENEELKS
ncbi:MAG: twin-arginine translocase TatA/TatE family subunit [Bacteroidaceae bacterium]|nr:twin-arginine translocase TatA/TatE family subunit [Bacteroidaceae bacterium]